MRLNKIAYSVLAQLIPVLGLAQQSDLKATYLRTEYKVTPVIDANKPRLSWELTSAKRGQMQTIYQIVVASSPGLLSTAKADLWNSGLVKSDATNQVEYAGKTLKSREVCYWKVRSWDKSGKAGAWSSVATWEMGLLNKKEWNARWVGNDLNYLNKGKEYHLPPAPFYRKEATLSGTIKKARLYVTALGLYEFYINGKKIGKDHFTPGWTDYNKRVYYQTYDVTADLRQGKNVLHSMVSYGWYAGYLGYALFVKNPVVKNFYGDVPLLKAQLEIQYANGKKQVIVTDGSWQTNHGPIVESDILNGETYNAQLEFKGWEKAGYRATGWKNASEYPEKAGRETEAYPGNPVQIVDEIKPKTITAKSEGRYIVDMGQNFAGMIRLKVKGKAGDTVKMRYGEVLFPDGNLMTENLRKARATDTYILKGDPNGETWQPRFTYHGFQYVEISGLRDKPLNDLLTGLVLSSTTPKAGKLETDNQLINQLYHNIVWTQRSNYFDIPTDCPQRDERLGWTGDAQVYIQSATFNSDIAAFFNKWLVDLNDAQRADHTYPLYAPAPNIRATDTYSPGWSEAGIICPYHIYKTYGDTKVIKQYWPNMVAYLSFLQTKSKGQYYFPEASFEELNPKGGFGDWLSVGKKTPPDMLATMYYAQCSSMMAEMADAIGRAEDAKHFTTVFEKVKQAFIDHYADAQGRFKTDAARYGNGAGYVDGEMGFDGHTQTGYANAIYMGLLKSDENIKAGNWLAGLIAANGDKLSTGFLGVKPLLPSLSATGHSDVAYKLLLSTTYPSWGFEIINGSNTIWERWNSYIKGKGFENNAGMNSFNHYAFGSVNEWLFGNMAGIQIGSAGYKTFTIRPEISPENIGYVKATYHSINGEIVSSWKKIGSNLVLYVTVPVNTKATIYIPVATENAVTEQGRPVTGNPDFKFIGIVNNYLVLEAGSGTYQFNSKNLFTK